MLLFCLSCKCEIRYFIWLNERVLMCMYDFMLLFIWLVFVISKKYIYIKYDLNNIEWKDVYLLLN